VCVCVREREREARRCHVSCTGQNQAGVTRRGFLQLWRHSTSVPIGVSCHRSLRIPSSGRQTISLGMHVVGENRCALASTATAARALAALAMAGLGVAALCCAVLPWLGLPGHCWLPLSNGRRAQAPRPRLFGTPPPARARASASAWCTSCSDAQQRLGLGAGRPPGQCPQETCSKLCCRSDQTGNRSVTYKIPLLALLASTGWVREDSFSSSWPPKCCPPLISHHPPRPQP